MPLTAAVVRGSSRALVVADLPFGSYQSSPQQALESAARFMKEAGAHAVKLEGGRRILPQVEALVSAGIPVMAHLGLTPQSVNVLGGYRVQGRGEYGEELMADAKDLEHAGAFSVVLECVPADLAARVTASLSIPTDRHRRGPRHGRPGAGLAGPHGPHRRARPSFVKQYSDLAGDLDRAARAFADDVTTGAFPAPEHTYR